jgi:hypothetical protein
MTLQEEKPMDRPYSRPQLVIYGDIQEITQSAGNMGNMDGGSGSMAKTQT